MGRVNIGWIFVCVFLHALMNTTDRARGQGLERESLSVENVNRQLRQSGANPEYNLRLGPVTLRAEAEVTTSFNDNTNLAKQGRIADMIVTPFALLRARWQVSELNTVDLHLGIGYQMYLTHSRYNDLLLAPDSIAQFNFSVGEVVMNMHDSFSYQQDPTQIGQLSNATRLSRFQNDAGVGATWQLGSVIVSLNYDHGNLWVTQSAYSYLTNQSDTVSPKVTVKVGDRIDVGVDASYSSVRYEKSFQNDYSTYSAGPFVSLKFSDFLSVDARVGGYLSEFSRGGGNGDSENVSSYYLSGGVNHKINNAFSEALTTGHEFLPGLTSNFTERVYANYTDTWQASEKIEVGSSLWWENLTDSNAAFRETSNRYSFGVNVTDILSTHATLSLGYQYILKDANPSELSYNQNLGTVGFRYQF